MAMEAAYPIKPTRNGALIWPSHCVAETSSPACTIALGDGRRNEGIANSRQAPSQITMSPTKAAAGASRSPQTRKATMSALRDGTAEELPADMVCERMKGRVRQGGHRARSRQVNVDHFAHPARPRRHHDDAVGQQHRLRDGMRDEQHCLRPLGPNAQELEAHFVARK